MTNLLRLKQIRTESETYPPLSAIAVGSSLTPVWTSGVVQKLMSRTGISATTVDSIAISTLTANCIVTSVNITVTAADTISVGPTINLGLPGFPSLLIPDTTLTNLLDVSDEVTVSASGLSHLVVANLPIIFNISTGATGTSQTITVDVTGYLVT